MCARLAEYLALSCSPCSFKWGFENDSVNCTAWRITVRLHFNKV
jgi:hypothetical protein